MCALVVILALTTVQTGIMNAAEFDHFKVKESLDRSRTQKVDQQDKNDIIIAFFVQSSLQIVHSIITVWLLSFGMRPFSMWWTCPSNYIAYFL